MVNPCFSVCLAIAGSSFENSTFTSKRALEKAETATTHALMHLPRPQRRCYKHENLMVKNRNLNFHVEDILVWGKLVLTLSLLLVTLSDAMRGENRALRTQRTLGGRFCHPPLMCPASRSPTRIQQPHRPQPWCTNRPPYHDDNINPLGGGLIRC